MSIAVLMATSPYTPSFSYLSHPNVPAQEDVALASGPEPKGVGGGQANDSNYTAIARRKSREAFPSCLGHKLHP